mmetsp:Transcript_9726/g.16258  ORF Transcript_9726/g.16258 Transcript_9726/m.16258 type:complete len:121 (-) Transcript_9726:8-370(-)
MEVFTHAIGKSIIIITTTTIQLVLLQLQLHLRQLQLRQQQRGQPHYERLNSSCLGMTKNTSKYCRYMGYSKVDSESIHSRTRKKVRLKNLDRIGGHDTTFERFELFELFRVPKNVRRQYC